MKRILFIDDDELLTNVLAQKIRNEGFEVSIIADGAEGLKQIGIQKPDLVLLDILLPSMNGYEVLENVRKDAAIAPTPVIIISNSGQPIEMDRAHNLGVKDYLLKGQLGPEDVMAKVHAYLGQGEKKVEQQRLAGRKILWIEDDQFLSSILAVKLSHEGCTAMYAKNGEEALEMINRETPDIILLDLLLPGMSGFDLLTEIRTKQNIKHVPIIVLSNLGQKDDMEKTRELGANKYLIKAEHDLDDIITEISKTLTAEPLSHLTDASVV